MAKQKKSEVARLDAPEAPEQPVIVDQYEEFARKALQRGMNQRTIADQLVKAGVDRSEASRIALRVWKENPAMRRENAMILFGASTLFLAIFLIFQVVPLVRGEGLPEPSVVYVLLIPAGWFLYKAIHAYRETFL